MHTCRAGVVVPFDCQSNFAELGIARESGKLQSCWPPHIRLLAGDRWWWPKFGLWLLLKHCHLKTAVRQCCSRLSQGGGASSSHSCWALQGVPEEAAPAPARKVRSTRGALPAGRGAEHRFPPACQVVHAQAEGQHQVACSVRCPGPRSPVCSGIRAHTLQACLTGRLLLLRCDWLPLGFVCYACMGCRCLAEVVLPPCSSHRLWVGLADPHAPATGNFRGHGNQLCMCVIFVHGKLLPCIAAG